MCKRITWTIGRYCLCCFSAWPSAAFIDLASSETALDITKIQTSSSAFENAETPDSLPPWHFQQSSTEQDKSLPEKKIQGLAYRPIRRGSPRPSMHRHFDINEHLPWMIVLLLLLVLVIIVVCSVKRSSRVLKKGPRQDPSSIIEKAIHNKSRSPSSHNKEKWIYYSNGHGEI